MYARLSTSTILKKLVESISKLVEEIELSISPTGIQSQSLDSSKTSLIYFNLVKEGFKENDFFCERPITLGVNIKDLATIMKCGANEESVALKCENDPRGLEVIFENESEEKLSHFGLSLININNEPVEIKDTLYTSVICMPSSKFSKICQDLANISDVLNIVTGNSFVKFSVTSDNNFNGNILIKNEHGDGSTKIDVILNLTIITIFKLTTFNILKYYLR